MLLFDWDTVHGAPLLAVRAKRRRSMNDGTFACDAVAFVIETGTIILGIDDDSDEIIVSFDTAIAPDESWQPLVQLEAFLSRPLS